jgi:hypothetical protein
MFAMLLGFAVAFLLSFSDGPAFSPGGVNKATFDKIKVGMTSLEVEAIIGFTGHATASRLAQVVKYRGDNGRCISVLYLFEFPRVPQPDGSQTLPGPPVYCNSKNPPHPCDFSIYSPPAGTQKVLRASFQDNWSNSFPTIELPPARPCDKTAPENPFTVIVTPEKTEIGSQGYVNVRLQVVNSTNSPQFFQAMNCSWDVHWKSSNERVYAGTGWQCSRNFLETVILDPGQTYERNLEMWVKNAQPHEDVSLKMGFTPAGSEVTYWSNEVTVHIKAADQDISTEPPFTSESPEPPQAMKHP